MPAPDPSKKNTANNHGDVPNRLSNHQPIPAPTNDAATMSVPTAAHRQTPRLLFDSVPTECVACAACGGRGWDIFESHLRAAGTVKPPQKLNYTLINWPFQAEETP